MSSQNLTSSHAEFLCPSYLKSHLVCVMECQRIQTMINRTCTHIIYELNCDPVEETGNEQQMNHNLGASDEHG